MNADQQKRAVAIAALDHVQRFFDAQAIFGIGTGSTTDYFIEQLGAFRHRFAGGVASSQRTAQKLAEQGIKVVDLNTVTTLPVYVDGADQVTENLCMLKGGGGALTREKIVAAVAQHFICIADQSKLVEQLGKFPLPVEVVPMAREYVIRRLVMLGGKPRLRVDHTGQVVYTDNGNIIIDVHGLKITHPIESELAINHIVGVVENGLFAARAADALLLGCKTGVRVLHRSISLT